MTSVPARSHAPGLVLHGAVAYAASSPMNSASPATTRQPAPAGPHRRPGPAADDRVP